MECCQNARGLDLRLRSALFLAFELSFSRLPFLAGHCFSRSIVVRPADRRRRSQELGPKPLFFWGWAGLDGTFLSVPRPVCTCWSVDFDVVNGGVPKQLHYRAVLS